MDYSAALFAVSPAFTEALGFWAGICTTASFLPQVIETRKSGGKGLSWLMLLLFSSGVGLWFIYGALRQSWPIILANAATGAQLLLILYFKLSRKSDGGSDPSKK